MKRDFEKEKKMMIQYQSATLYAPVISLTIAYYLVAKLIFGADNYYVGAILAGLTGSFWSLVASNGYKIYLDTKRMDAKNWYSQEAYKKRLQYCSKIVLIFFAFLVIEIILIVLFKL